MKDWRRIKISKFLSYVLRHDPEKIKLNMDSAGWVKIDELIEKSQSEREFTREEFDEIVKGCDSQRFTVSKDGKSVRSAQGHTLDIDLKLKSVVPPDKLYHGTAWKSVEKIMKEGLQKMERQHVHMYSEERLEKAKSTGARHGKSVILEIESRKFWEHGYVVYKSDNNVYLTDHVPPQYIKIKN